MNSNDSNNLTLCLGLTLLLTLVVSSVIIGLSFIFHHSIRPWQFPTAFVISALAAWQLCGGRLRQLWAVGAAALIAGCTIFVCSLIYDSTFDSILYHYNIVVMLTHGWNPFYEPPLNGNILAEHYSKGLELLQAAVLATFNNLQAVKGVNFILVISSLCILWHTLLTVFPQIEKRWRWGIVVIAALNPVVIQFSMSGYNDYALWPETIILLCGFSLALKEYRQFLPWLLVASAFILAVNTKFTHFFYIGLACIIFAVWCVCIKRNDVLWRGCITVFVSFIAGVFIIGWNPYITNLIGFGSPVYPLGTEKIDIMTSNTPEMFQNGNRFIYFLKSLLSVYDSPWGMLTGNMSPYAISLSYASDMRVNGFGVLMMPMLLCALALMILSRPKFRYWIIYISIFALCMSFEQAWWARYIPFLWLAIIMPIICSFYSNYKGRWIKILRSAILVMCVANGVASFCGMAYSRMSYTSYINYVFNRAKERNCTLRVAYMGYAYRQQFDERNIKYIEYPQPEDLTKDLQSDSTMFRIFGTDFFNSVVELPPEIFPEAYRQPQTISEKLIRFDTRRFKIKSPSENPDSQD